MTKQTRTPADIDTELADQHQAVDQAWHERERLTDSLHRLVGDTRDRDGQWTMSQDRVLAEVGDKYADQKQNLPYGTRLTTITEKLEAAQQAADAAGRRIRELDAQYEAAGRWTRFYLARSSDGHVHSHQECSTCHHGNQRTKFGWLTELSGRTEAEAVEIFGETMCTVCYPSAPADPNFRSPGSRAQAAIDARNAEKAAKQAAKDAKAIANPDGTPIVLSSGWDRPTTYIGARNLLSDRMRSVGFYRGLDGKPHPSEPGWLADIEILLAAMAHKTGRTVEDIRTEYQGKADKKVARDLKN